jgi:hypothetical protein
MMCNDKESNHMSIPGEEREAFCLYLIRSSALLGKNFNPGSPSYGTTMDNWTIRINVKICADSEPHREYRISKQTLRLQYANLWTKFPTPKLIARAGHKPENERTIESEEPLLKSKEAKPKNQNQPMNSNNHPLEKQPLQTSLQTLPAADVVDSFFFSMWELFWMIGWLNVA